jgi:L-fuconolactonase
VIIDAHHHVWDPARAVYPWMTEDVAALRRRYGPEHLEPLLREHGVDGTVLVQARTELAETRELLETAAAQTWVLGVVGWIDLERDVPAQLAELDGPLVGVRHLVQDEPDPRWLLRPEVQRGIAAVGDAGLVYDLLVRPPQLPAAVKTARRNAGVRFVLDHVGKRPSGGESGWREGVAALAELPNVVCKVSGVFTEHDPEGTVALALEWFGPDRCMFGSDWPVSTLAVEYGETLAVAGRDPHVLGATATRWYGLTT